MRPLPLPTRRNQTHPHPLSFSLRFFPSRICVRKPVVSTHTRARARSPSTVSAPHAHSPEHRQLPSPAVIQPPLRPLSAQQSPALQPPAAGTCRATCQLIPHSTALLVPYLSSPFPPSFIGTRFCLFPRSLATVSLRSLLPPWLLLIVSLPFLLFFFRPAVCLSLSVQPPPLSQRGHSSISVSSAHLCQVSQRLWTRSLITLKASREVVQSTERG